MAQMTRTIALGRILGIRLSLAIAFEDISPPSQSECAEADLFQESGDGSVQRLASKLIATGKDFSGSAINQECCRNALDAVQLGDFRTPILAVIDLRPGHLVFL